MNSPLTCSQWLDRVCALFITEARNYQVWNKVPPEDLDEDIVKVGVDGEVHPCNRCMALQPLASKGCCTWGWSEFRQGPVKLTWQTAARTAFQNFAKRYMAEVDPKHAKKKEKYVKNRRRWARKDLVSASISSTDASDFSVSTFSMAAGHTRLLPQFVTVCRAVSYVSRVGDAVCSPGIACVNLLSRARQSAIRMACVRK